MTNDFFDFTVDYQIQKADEGGKLAKRPSSKCRVCREPLIMELVNKMLALSFTGPSILNTLASHNIKAVEDGLEPITIDCIKNHRTRHFDSQCPSAVVLRKLQEFNASRMSSDNIEDMFGTLLNARTFHETMMIKGYEALTDPHSVVSPELGAKSAQWLYEQDRKEEEGRDMAQMQAEFGRMIEVIRRFIPGDQWPEVQAVLRGEPVVKEKPKAVPAVRMVSIDDSDEEGA